MKVVIFAGGHGTRMREGSDSAPKPMVDLGGRPVLWHLMKIFSSAGHNEFIICGGYKVDVVKQYFLNLRAWTSDFTVETDSQRLEFHSESEKWRVTVVDTGLWAETGSRLKQVSSHLDDNEPFFCTYGDGLAPVNLRVLLESHLNSGRVATLTSAKVQSRFGALQISHEGLVEQFVEKPVLPERVSIGFFVFDKACLNLINGNESLEAGMLPKLAQAGQLNQFEHEGFWEPMDTFREYQNLNQLWDRGEAPWKVWD